MVPTVRVLRPEDAEELANFQCSTSAWYENEVESYVRQMLLPRHQSRAPHTDHRAIALEMDGFGIVAVGSHEAEIAFLNQDEIQISVLEVAAVRRDFQGYVLSDLDFDNGKPITIGRYLVDSILSDALSRENREPFALAIVARENVRSLSLCEQIGLMVETDDLDDRFVRRSGRF
jgi:hypothetical protein